MLLGLRSRRQFRFESDTAAFVKNLNTLAGSDIKTAPHDDTIVYYLKQVQIDPFEKLPAEIVRRLIRMKVLDGSRLYGHFLIAIDGTGQFFFRERHCPYCLTRKRADGTLLYFHHVLEAKLVTKSGLAFSMATEFIENTNPQSGKQDCEIKAFYRLAKKLKENFPQLHMCLLGDAIYDKAPVFDVCNRNKWKFIFTFKSGAMPALFQEYQTLRNLDFQNRTEFVENNKKQCFSWINDLNHGGHILSAFECRETTQDKKQYFAWITNFTVGCRSVISLANQGGRCRWKIENEGFKNQKRHGYELEHAYSQNEKVSKIFYFLLQVAHIINQLIQKGSLIKNFRKTLGSIRNYLRRFAEAFRNIPFALIEIAATKTFQIRLGQSP